MSEGKTVSQGRLWGEAIGLAAISFGALALAQLIGILIYAEFIAEAGTIGPGQDNRDVLAKVGLLSLPFGAILTLGLAFWFLKFRQVNWQDLGLRKPDNIFRTIFIGVGIFLLALLLLTSARIGLSALGFERELGYFSFLPGDLVMYIYLITVSSWFSAAFAEEFIFRGFIMGNIAKALGDTQKAWAMAAIIQAVIFALFHAYQGISGIATTGIVALVFGFFYYRIRSLWPVIIAHGLGNVYGYSKLYFGIELPF